MFDLQSAVKSAVQSDDCSADLDQTYTFQYTIPANGRSKKNTVGMVVNRLVGLGLKANTALR